MSIQVSSSNNEVMQRSPLNRDGYLLRLLDQTGSPETDLELLRSLRSQSKLLIQEQAFPTTRDEEWRFTDLSSLLQVNFEARTSQSSVSSEQIAPFTLPEAAESRLVFVNGVYQPHLSSVKGLPKDLYVGSLSELLAGKQEEAIALQSRLSHYLGKQPGAAELFTALNTANLTDAAIIWAPKNLVVETPIHLLFLSTAAASPVFSQPRCLVVAEPNSAVTLVEEYVGLDEGVYFTNSVTEVWVEANAQVNHSRIQRESKAAFHIGKTAVSQARDSRYTCTAISLGGKVSRHNPEIFQTGEQTETHLNGLTIALQDQLSDTHSAIAYSKPHGSSRQLHKCIVGDKAHGVFNGKVFVPQSAQLTDAGQLNRNLLLSPRARIDTKPQLEIVADNVKCTHGATVGQLDADEVFYLQSRGIDAASARNLLVYAFAFEVVEQVAIASLQDTLTHFLKTQIP
ncbi:Fe-S cluster assembly protein SufD [Leptolyngbya sp. FACHB-671]|uniref:Fe-S cluster assembly protein SufD n=1 Tax=Leptolyngbya sp. FACHB-671 TaxID=2692812 RepID=UPI001687B569|nr:Fe-S cluster assembly protein SufD [Leptolyngbya sp. FACHB-671]MBD2067927.1 Fe-S cluster assembly protein SufD [Leptolyngbya sp. FACHB-671]